MCGARAHRQGISTRHAGSQTGSSPRRATAKPGAPDRGTRRRGATGVMCAGVSSHREGRRRARRTARLRRSFRSVHMPSLNMTDRIAAASMTETIQSRSSPGRNRVPQRAGQGSKLPRAEHHGYTTGAPGARNALGAGAELRGVGTVRPKRGERVMRHECQGRSARRGYANGNSGKGHGTDKRRRLEASTSENAHAVPASAQQTQLRKHDCAVVQWLRGM